MDLFQEMVAGPTAFISYILESLGLALLGKNAPNSNRGGNRMTKEELRQYKSLKEEKEQLEELLLEIELTKTAPKTAKISSERHGSPSGSGLEALVAKYEEIERCYHAKLDEIADRLLAIENAIDSLDVTERKLMRHRYIEGLTWEEVCVAINYGWAQTHRIHAKALEALKSA
jgi:DNA-directed RNA polymerase specialized sigma subunit